MIYHDKCEYQPVSNDCALLKDIKGSKLHLVVPAEVFSENKRRYQIIGIKEFTVLAKMLATTISFDDSSEITEIPTSFFDCCKFLFILPPKIKRVRGCMHEKERKLRIINKYSKQFVSVVGKRNIMNHHPLELLYYHQTGKHFFIRETVRIVGKYASCRNLKLVSVVFPASVEIIDDYAFMECNNLAAIQFNGNSKLKKIGCFSFCLTAIKIINFPSSLEEIGDDAFIRSSKLQSVAFAKNSKLRLIGKNAFSISAVEHLELPDSLEEIGDRAFYECRKLSSITLSKDIKQIKIGEGAFRRCPCSIQKH